MILSLAEKKTASVVSVYFVWTIGRITVTGENGSRGKAIPLQTWTGPEGSRRMRFSDFKAIGT